MKWLQLGWFLAVACLTACGEKLDASHYGEPAPALNSQPPAELRILIIGGTSGVGLATTKLALERGHHVTAMARRPERMTVSHKQLDTTEGDILNIASVTSAMMAVDAVVITIGIGPTRKPVTVFSKGTANVLKAMAQHDVKRVLMITGIGAGDSRGHGGFFYDEIMQPLLLDTVYADKEHAETLIFSSESQWTVVRPGFLNDDASKKSYRVVQDMRGVTSGKISRSDVAHFLVSALETGSYIGATVLLTN